MHLHCQLYLKVLFKLLLALKLIENEFPILRIVNEGPELGVCLVEPHIHLPNLSLALNDVNKVALLHVFMHCLESRFNSIPLKSHLFELRVQLVLKLFLHFLLLLEVLPELPLKGVDVFLGQLEELL